jgi:thiol:disulfide interchange protein DsbG
MTKTAYCILVLSLLNIHVEIYATEISAPSSTKAAASIIPKTQLAQNELKNKPSVSLGTPTAETATATSEARISGRKELQPEAWANLKTLQGIEIKSKPNDLIQLIIFFDPNCPHCAELWQRLYGKEAKQKQMASLWIPVAYMKKDSEGRAAYLLDHATRPALAANFEAFDQAARSGAAPVAITTPQVNTIIKRNMAFWQKLFPATPLIVFRTQSNQTFLQIGLSPAEQFEQLLQLIPSASLDGFQK